MNMVAILDLKATLAKMPMMQGRRPESTEAERKATGAFVTLTPYRDGNIYSAKFSGRAAWERHPNGDELVQIVDARGIGFMRRTVSVSSPRRRARLSTSRSMSTIRVR
jgi:hypothetical protein